jgi:hypothetical protein
MSEQENRWRRCVRFSQRLLTVLGIAALTAVACNVSNIAGPNDLRRLAQAQARAGKRGRSRTYSYEIRSPVSPTGDQPLDARVREKWRGGRRGGRNPIRSSPITTIQWWQPIDSLFATLHRAMTTDSFSSVYANRGGLRQGTGVSGPSSTSRKPTVTPLRRLTSGTSPCSN